MMGVTFVMSNAEKKRQAFPLRAVNGCIVGKNGMHINTSGKQKLRNDGQGILRCPPGFEHVRSGRDEESGKGPGTDENRTLQENVAACNESNHVRPQGGACDRLDANNDTYHRKRSASLMDNQGAVEWRRVSPASSSSSGAGANRLRNPAFPAKENSQSNGKAESKRKAKSRRKAPKRQSGRTENKPKEQMLMTGLDSAASDAVSIPNRDGECKPLWGKRAQEPVPCGNSSLQQAQDDNSQQARVDSIARGLHYILLDSGEIHLCAHNEDCTASSKHVVNGTWVDPKGNKAVQGCDLDCKRRTRNEFSKEDFHNLLADSFSKFHNQADKTPKLAEEQTFVLPENRALRRAEESSSSQLSEPVKVKSLDKGRNARQAILDAVSASCAGKLASEHFALATGKHLAEIEKVLQVVAPSFATSPADCHLQARVYPCCCMKTAELCKIADVPLKSIWEWYEKPSSCGIEVKSCRASDSEQFNAYLVPYLSGLQLFGRVPPKERDSSKFDRNADHHSSLTGNSSTERLLKPTPAEEASNLSLLYEFFEVEQPQLRMPLLQKIRELIGGNAGSDCISKGDPKTLEDAFLGNLHPASWFAVSWYPIYKIPEGQFRSVFLTYHSLGHVSQGNDGRLSLPVIGLQTYNCQAEHWFSLEGGFEELAKQSMEAMYIKLVVDPVQALRERLSTLDRAAEALSRGMLESPDPKSRSSKHQDYEFFSSRKR